MATFIVAVEQTNPCFGYSFPPDRLLGSVLLPRLPWHQLLRVRIPVFGRERRPARPSCYGHPTIRSRSPASSARTPNRPSRPSLKTRPRPPTRSGFFVSSSY